MSDQAEFWAEHKAVEKIAKHQRMEKADSDFDSAKWLAKDNGMILIQRSAYHFQLRWLKQGWLLNLYPTNQRLYWDRSHQGPFLKMPETRDWTLFDIVSAAIAQV